MDFNKLSKLGAFLGSVAAVGGVVVTLLGYFFKGDDSKKEAPKVPVEIKVSDAGTVTQKTIAKTESLLGLWSAQPMEIFTAVSPAWTAKKQSDARNYYDPQTTEASARFTRAEQRDELMAHFTLVNGTFDHHFRAIVKVTENDTWLLKVTHQKQYGAEPNLQVSHGEIAFTESGRLRIDFTITDYAEITFFAELDKAGQ